jgi:hypothetical protein
VRERYVDNFNDKSKNRGDREGALLCPVRAHPRELGWLRKCFGGFEPQPTPSTIASAPREAPVRSGRILWYSGES